MSSFCFFKQNAAYEMRISDWISDVCSSDLQNIQNIVRDDRRLRQRRIEFGRRQQRSVGRRIFRQRPFAVDRDQPAAGQDRPRPANRILLFLFGFDAETRELRSEEHTSELQSLMRISYAVFFLKTKTITIYTCTLMM